MKQRQRPYPMQRQNQHMGEDNTDAIRTVVTEYLQQNPPTIDPLQMKTARDFIDARIRMAARKLPDLIEQKTKKNYIMSTVIGAIVGAAVVFYTSKRR